MWNLPVPGIKPVLLTLICGFLSIVPPGKSPLSTFEMPGPHPGVSDCLSLGYSPELRTCSDVSSLFQVEARVDALAGLQSGCSVRLASPGIVRDAEFQAHPRPTAGPESAS